MNPALLIFLAIWTIIRFGLPPALAALGLVDIRIPLFSYLLGCAAVYGLCGINIVKQWNRRPVMRLGKYVETLGPGLRWIDPVFHSFLEDESVQEFVDELSVENIQTHDNVPISFSLILTRSTKADDIQTFLTKVDDGWTACEQRAIAVATECVGNAELDQILHNRQSLYENITALLQSRVRAWGITIGAVELQNIKITDPTVEQAIAMKARARKEGEAELARAEMQQRVAKQLHEASKEYDEQSWKLKGLETLLELCRSAENNTILIPTDVLDAVARLSGKKA